MEEREYVKVYKKYLVDLFIHYNENTNLEEINNIGIENFNYLP